jgi:phospholipase A1
MDMTKPRARMGVLFLAAAGSASATLVQAAPNSAADCHAIAASMERLACYDAVSGRAAEVAKGTAAAATAPASTASAATVAPVDVARQVESGGTAPTTISMIDNAWDFDPASAPFDIRFHNANYLLFGRYTDNVNNAPYLSLVQGTSQAESELSSTEAKFQISFKARLWTTDDRRWGLWAAYTQQSQWQLYNGDTSRPFRENNYWRPSDAGG